MLQTEANMQVAEEEVPGPDIRAGSADHPLEEFTLK